MQNSARALLVIINDILDYSKLDAERMQLEHLRFDLLALVNEVMELFRPRIADNPIDLIISMSARICRTALWRSRHGYDRF